MTRLLIGLLAIPVVLYLALVAISPREASPLVPVETATSTDRVQSEPDRVIADTLSIPWDIAFLPDGSMLVTERTGDVLHITDNGSSTRLSVTRSVSGEAGLLGIVLHPNFATNNYVYIYLSTAEGDGTKNAVIRYTYANETLTKDKDIIANIPGALYHDGGRLEFGPDGKLYITTGDATRGTLAQNKNSLAGKILRLNDDGTVPSDNPFGTAVWSYGHRNPQGLAWDSSGQLWESEHGPTGEDGRCCHDEINKIEAGGNYGWPDVIGDETKAGTIGPVLQSGDDTWAPASLMYWNGSLYFGALKGTALMRAPFSGGTVVRTERTLSDTYGRIRTVRVGPDRMFYITTSNTDGRGRALPIDDRIVRVDPSSLR
jgi:glucose/arabinose dehydrogenase